MHVLDSIDIHGWTVKVVLDPEPTSPREWDNGTVLCASQERNGDVGAPTIDPSEMDDAEIVAMLKEDYDAIEVHSFMDPATFETRYLYMTEKGRQEMGTPRDRVADLLEGDASVYVQWSEGEVYGYIVEDPRGNHVDSCWGYYSEAEAASEGQAIVEAHIRELDADLDRWASLAGLA